MLPSDLITTARLDYLDDKADPFLWDDKSLLRKISEAERQVCTRGDLIYDDTTAGYTKITLVNEQASYSFSQKLTVIENILFDGVIIEKKTKSQMDVISATWRTDAGMTGKVIYAVISGRKIRFSRIADATDAGKVVSLEVYRLPDEDITSTCQEFEIPEENHRDLIYWVLHECYKKQDADSFNQEKSDYYLERFNEVFGEPVSAKVRQHQFESPRTLSFTPSSYFKPSEVSDTDW